MRSMAGPASVPALGASGASFGLGRCPPAWQRGGGARRTRMHSGNCAWPRNAATAQPTLPICTRYRGCCAAVAATPTAATAAATAAARSSTAVAATLAPASSLARGAVRLHATAGRGRGSSSSSSRGSSTGGVGSSNSRGGRAQELLGVGGEEEDEEEDEEEGAWDEEEEGEEGEDEDDDDGAEVLGRSVVQVHTLHRVPNFLRPWEDGHDAESTSSAFVVEVEVEVPVPPSPSPSAPAPTAAAAGGGGGGSGLRSRGRSSRGAGPGGARPAARGAQPADAAAGAAGAVGVLTTRRVRQRLLVTTAGAVEHARKLEVSRSADDAAGPYPAHVAAVCLDLDVALLRVDDPAFWRSGSSSSGGDGSSSSSGGDGSSIGGSSSSSSASARERRRRLRAGGEGGGGGDDESEAAEAAEEAGAGPGGGGDDDDEALVPLQLDRSLPNLRRPVVVAGFPLGGAGLCVTSGVVSRVEVVEYSHSGRALLALQVDAPMNNGGWGGPALCPATGRCVGMAFQKFTSQTWMERYDDAALEMYGGGGDDDEEEGGGGGYDGGGEDGAPGQDYGDEDAENIGYLVPSQSLALVLEDYCRAVEDRTRQAVAAAAAAVAAAATAATATAARGGGSSSTAATSSTSGGPRQRGAAAAASSSSSSAASSASSSSSSSSSSPLLYLDGRPRLGIRYQRMESPALRRAFGLPVTGSSSGSSSGGSGSGGSSSSGGSAAQAWRSGVLVTGVDPTGSAAGVVQVHDVLLAVGGRPVSDDATTALAAPAATGSSASGSSSSSGGRRGQGQRVLFGHWAAVGRVGQQLGLTVLRQGRVLELPVTLRGAGWPYLPVSVGPAGAAAAAAGAAAGAVAGAGAVSGAGGPRRAQFLVAGPLVFAAFTLPYWYQMVGSLPGSGSVRHMGRAAARQLQSGLVPVLGALEWGMPAAPGEEEIVLLVEVLECGGGGDEEDDEDEVEVVEVEADAGSGSGSGSGGRASAAGEAAAWSAELRGAPRRVTAVNGQQVRSLAHLAEAIVAAAPASGTAPADASQFLRLLLEPHPPAITAPPHHHGSSSSSSSSSGADASISNNSDSSTSTNTSDGTSSNGASSTSSSNSSNGSSSNGSSSSSSIGGTVVVLDCGRLAGDTLAVLRHHAMSAAMTPDLRRRLGTAWPFEGGAQAGQSGPGPRGRRQQGRRFALSGRR